MTRGLELTAFIGDYEETPIYKSRITHISQFILPFSHIFFTKLL